MANQVIGFMTDKADGGGYRLSRIVSLEGEVKTETITYRTTLIEVQGIEHRLKEKLFGEAACPPPQYAPPASTMFPVVPRPVEPPPEHVMTNGYEPPDGFPNSVEEQRHENGGGMMGRFGNGIRSYLPVLFLAGCWLALNASRLGLGS